MSLLIALKIMRVIFLLEGIVCIALGIIFIILKQKSNKFKSSKKIIIISIILILYGIAAILAGIFFIGFAISDIFG